MYRLFASEILSTSKSTKSAFIYAHQDLSVQKRSKLHAGLAGAKPSIFKQILPVSALNVFPDA